MNKIMTVEEIIKRIGDLDVTVSGMARFIDSDSFMTYSEDLRIGYLETQKDLTAERDNLKKAIYSIPVTVNI